MKASLSVLGPGRNRRDVSLRCCRCCSARWRSRGKGQSAYPMDCTKWKDKARCESLNRDIEACKAKTDDEWRTCMHLSAPAAKFTPPKPRDCSKSSNKQLCEAYSNALKACKDKATQADYRKCMTEQF